MIRPHVLRLQKLMPVAMKPLIAMTRYHIAILLMLMSALSAVAQTEDGSARTHSLVLGAGSTDQLDTYLSPRDYSGFRFMLLRETLRMTHMAGRRISFQTLWQGDFSYSRNSAHTATDMGGHIGYDALWHYNWTPVRGLRLMAGGAVGGDVGFLYNSRGGNNPAQARIGLDVSASVMAVYRLRLWGTELGLRYQADMPFAGVMFSPQFGQSYYEIGEGYFDGNVCFAHPGNAFSLWQQFTLDIPVGRYVVLRTGYVCDIRQSHVNDIKVHDRSHSFVIGFVKHFRRIGKGERRALGTIL